jgi:hypothetical protein
MPLLIVTEQVCLRSNLLVLHRSACANLGHAVKVSLLLLFRVFHVVRRIQVEYPRMRLSGRHVSSNSLHCEARHHCDKKSASTPHGNVERHSEVEVKPVDSDKEICFKEACGLFDSDICVGHREDKVPLWYIGEVGSNVAAWASDIAQKTEPARKSEFTWKADKVIAARAELT